MEVDMLLVAGRLRLTTAKLLILSTVAKCLLTRVNVTRSSSRLKTR